MKTAHPIIIGIDTHKATHVAVAIDTQGGLNEHWGLHKSTTGPLYVSERLDKGP